VLERLAIEEDVDATFLGFVSEPAMHLARASHVFAPGYLAMLEAMALQRPVFCVYHNPIKESYLRDIPGAGEMLHIAGSPEELADQLAEHLHSPGTSAAMVSRAGAFAARHSWAHMVDNHLRLWAR
jgi:glycosyltransferase involved in cell wall biosynthesis